MALHFTRDEFAVRRRRVCEQMGKAGLDGLLIFRQESMYWLTGYDTSGYSMFQGLYLRADGALALLTRSADLRQARLTSAHETAPGNTLALLETNPPGPGRTRRFYCGRATALSAHCGRQRQWRLPPFPRAKIEIEVTARCRERAGR